MFALSNQKEVLDLFCVWFLRSQIFTDFLIRTFLWSLSFFTDAFGSKRLYKKFISKCFCGPIKSLFCYLALKKKRLDIPDLHVKFTNISRMDAKELREIINEERSSLPYLQLERRSMKSGLFLTVYNTCLDPAEDKPSQNARTLLRAVRTFLAFFPWHFEYEMLKSYFVVNPIKGFAFVLCMLYLWWLFYRY